MCKLSIIMPIYNKQVYLRESIEKILSWDNEGFELILIDDGSTDNSLHILKQFKEKDIRIKLKSVCNGGVSSARNIGLSIAKGTWIWFVDADDIPNMEFPRYCLEEAEKCLFDIYVGDFIKGFGVDEKDEIVRNPHKGLFLSYEIPDLYKDLQPATGYYGYLWNKIIRRDLIIDNDIRFKVGLTLAEDLEFMVSIYMNCKSMFISDTIAMYYRIDSENSSKNKKIDYFAQLQIQVKVRKWFISLGKEHQNKEFLATNITRYAAFVIFYANEDRQSITEISNKLLSDPEVIECLIPWDDPGVMGRIASYLRKRQIQKLKLYLLFRGLVRSLYRIGR